MILHLLNAVEKIENIVSSISKIQTKVIQILTIYKTKLMSEPTNP